MAEALSDHLVLARKWRPDRFAELVGQEHVTRTLAEALKRGRIAHAFLFTGIRGVGKTTAARILSRCLNCANGPTPDPCGECAACVEIRAGRSLDVSEIDGATYRKIDDARAIIENLSYRPARDRFKIYIIDEAHQLTDQAFNALLKTLEEPPPHIKFILATTEPQKMPDTILSRLQRYDFRRIALPVIFARLKELASRENAAAEESALMLLAREAGGSMRDAERMLETAIATASGEKITEAEVASNLGVTSRSVVYQLCESILNKDPASALRRVRELHGRGANLESLGRDLLEVIRNLTVAKIPANDSLNPLADIPDHEATELKRLSSLASNRDLMRLFHLMAQTQEEILRSPFPDLLTEMAIIRMATIAPVVDADELIRAIHGAVTGPAFGSDPRGGSGAKPVAPENPPAARRIKIEGEVKAEAPVRSAPIPPAPSVPNKVQSDRPDQTAYPADDLPDLRGFIRSRRAALAGFMEQGASLALSGDLLSVAARNDIYVRYLSDNRATIADLAGEFFTRPIRVEIVSSGGVASAAPARSEIPRPPVSSQQIKLPPAAPEIINRGATDNGAKSSSASRAGNPEERAAVLKDPAMRQIFDTLEARLVEVRVKNPPAQSGTE